jgi:hypothetical protein
MRRDYAAIFRDRILRRLFRIRVAPHLTRPSKKPEKLPLLPPEQIPEITRPHRLRLLARISLQPPPQIGTPPRPQPVAPRRIPQKSQLFAHSSRPSFSIGTPASTRLCRILLTKFGAVLYIACKNSARRESENFNQRHVLRCTLRYEPIAISFCVESRVSVPRPRRFLSRRRARP